MARLVVLKAPLHSSHIHRMIAIGKPFGVLGKSLCCVVIGQLGYLLLTHCLPRWQQGTVPTLKTVANSVHSQQGAVCLLLIKRSQGNVVLSYIASLFPEY